MAFVSRGTLNPSPDHSTSDSPGSAPPVVSIHCQATAADPSLDAQPSGSDGSSARAARAKPHEPAVATPTAVRALLAANDTDSSHTIGGAACEPVIEDTSCRARASAGSGKSDSVAATTMTGRLFASSACGALSRRNTAGSLELPSSNIAPPPAELPPGALRHAVLGSSLRRDRLENAEDEAIEVRVLRAVAASKRHVRRTGTRCRRHRPQHAHRRPAHQHAVNRKWQAKFLSIHRPASKQGSRLQRAVEVGRVHLHARQRGAPPQPQPRRRLAATLPRRLQCAERGAVLQPGRRERSVEPRGVGRAAAPLPRRRQSQWPPRRRVRRRPLPTAVHRRHRLAIAAAHLERATLEQRALHPRRAPRLQRQRLQEEHSTQRSAHRRGRSHGGACRARRLQVGRAREDDAPTHDVIGHQRVQRAGHGRMEEGRAAQGSRQPTLQQRVDRIDPQEGAPAKAKRHTAARIRRRAARRALQHRVRNRAAVPERRHAARAKQVFFLRCALHRCQLHRPNGHLPSPSSGGRDHWVEDEELRVGRSCTA
eukprot:scaffold16824_cov81-Phaeocystis_antarctica.AAC.2